MFSNPYTHFPPHDDLAAPPAALDAYPGSPRFHAGPLPPYSPHDSGPPSAVDAFPSDQPVLPWAPSLLHPAPRERGKPKRHHADDSTGAAAQVRRQRVSRACDQCNQLRTKCDGRHPCAHCIGIHPPRSLGSPPADPFFPAARNQPVLRVHA